MPCFMIVPGQGCASAARPGMKHRQACLLICDGVSKTVKLAVCIATAVSNQRVFLIAPSTVCASYSQLQPATDKTTQHIVRDCPSLTCDTSLVIEQVLLALLQQEADHRLEAAH